MFWLESLFIKYYCYRRCSHSLEQSRIVKFITKGSDLSLGWIKWGCQIWILILTLTAEYRQIQYCQSILHFKMRWLPIWLLILIIIILLIKLMPIFDSKVDKIIVFNWKHHLFLLYNLQFNRKRQYKVKYWLNRKILLFNNARLISFALIKQIGHW